MNELEEWLVWQPWRHGDPGPETYHALRELPQEHQHRVIGAINTARSKVEAARAKGYQQIGAAIAKVAGS
jgi:hypothetical protein